MPDADDDVLERQLLLATSLPYGADQQQPQQVHIEESQSQWLSVAREDEDEDILIRRKRSLSESIRITTTMGAPLIRTLALLCACSLSVGSH
jgi:hypothetical protein